MRQRTDNFRLSIWNKLHLQPSGADTSMATAQQPAAHKVRRGVQPLRAGQGNSFIWRKLHSLLGIIPIGAFLAGTPAFEL